MKDIETWLKNRYREQLVHENSAFLSSIIHNYCTEVVKNNAVLPHCYVPFFIYQLKFKQYELSKRTQRR